MRPIVVTAGKVAVSAVSMPSSQQCKSTFTGMRRCSAALHSCPTVDDRQGDPSGSHRSRICKRCRAHAGRSSASQVRNNEVHWQAKGLRRHDTNLHAYDCRSTRLDAHDCKRCVTLSHFLAYPAPMHG